MLILSGHTNEVRSVAYSADGRTLASVSDDCTARLWDVAPGEEELVLEDHEQMVTCLAYSSDGKLVTGGHDAMLVWWNLKDGSVENRAYFSTPITALAFSPDGRYLAWGLERSAREGREHKLFFQHALHDRSTYSSLESSSSGVWSLAFSPDNRFMAIGQAGGNVIIRGVPDLKVLEEIRCATAVRALAFSPNNRYLAIASGAEVHLWDLESVDVVRTFGEPGRHYAWSLAFSPDSHQLMVGYWDAVVRLWDVGSGTQMQQFNWGLGRIHAVAFSPDGMTAAVAGGSHDILIWDVE